MKIFIDTANVNEIKKAAELGIIDGVTTNPSLIAKEGRNIKEVIEEICAIVDGPISAEVINMTASKMVEEGRELSKLHKNVVVKIPMCEEGLKAVNILSKENIKTNVTLIFSPQQALLASKAGANYVSPFMGRLDDIGTSSSQVISDIAQIFKMYNINTEIIAASIRNPIHILDCAKVGANIATIPYNLIMDMIKHPLTDKGIAKFLADYNNSLK
ncbi:fructose-6-phosphate aldolase [Clostridium tagluense]|uniref:Probable transaldolase n=1 Tax=Clostridium tagluense TaxID=360422 RepID=A0A401UFV4_9CLOT|nr:fructose-6-phosphate aldolase [Clostridium tagluense]MBU3129665.1 fructose-6-phosphate aldolase [Clostridium tagluense]MCB2300976.1 fructose-6-phosphate aldolase [Clostridium tagluense]MCB2314249.1 fructose-6-phosphate aldolase [Clostridium tagluense]MCB2319111.1 fructose-6-phosphate aldolase [Clostridium tagluense]MCB2323997.1 fructose-6-phosphate aldolase [Clostridium tagluense]